MRENARGNGFCDPQHSLVVQYCGALARDRRTQSNTDSPVWLLDARTRKLTALFSTRIVRILALGSIAARPKWRTAGGSCGNLVKFTQGHRGVSHAIHPFEGTVAAARGPWIACHRHDCGAIQGGDFRSEIKPFARGTAAHGSERCGSIRWQSRLAHRTASSKRAGCPTVPGWRRSVALRSATTEGPS